MAETTLVPPDLAAGLFDELARLRAARAMNPKHGTRAGAVSCDDRCQICAAEAVLDLLIAQIPRSGQEIMVAPEIGINFVEPWKITKSVDGPQDH